MLIGLRFIAFFESALRVLFRWNTLLVSLNLIYFGSILVGAFLAQTPYVIVYELPASDNYLLGTVDNAFLLALAIFFFNLVISGFLLTTLSGLIFFVIPFIVLAWRALLWGTLIAQAPSPQFFAVLPTFVLEGEAYVIAAAAGIILGLSWLKPEWVLKGDKMPRPRALRTAFTDCVRLYFWVILLLVAGAVVETVTLIYFS